MTNWAWDYDHWGHLGAFGTGLEHLLHLGAFYYGKGQGYRAGIGHIAETAMSRHMGWKSYNRTAGQDRKGYGNWKGKGKRATTILTLGAGDILLFFFTANTITARRLVFSSDCYVATITS